MAMIYFKIPGPLYQTSLFSPQFYASSFLFGSAGDLFLNVAFALAIVLIFYRHQRIIRIYSSAEPAPGNAILFYLFWALIIAATSAAVNYYVTGLIINSKISFDISNIFELNTFSILGFFIVAMLMGFYFLVIRFAGEIIHHSGFSTERKRRYMIFALAVILLFARKNIFPG